MGASNIGLIGSICSGESSGSAENLYWTINYGDADSAAKIARYRRNLRSVRWNFWHYGRSRHARRFIALSRLGSQILSHRNEIEDAGGDLARIEDAYKRFRELKHYAHANIGSLMDYGRAWRHGEPISTADIEGPCCSDAGESGF